MNLLYIACTRAM